jgi:hypothetical protein
VPGRLRHSADERLNPALRRVRHRCAQRRVSSTRTLSPVSGKNRTPSAMKSLASTSLRGEILICGRLVLRPWHSPAEANVANLRPTVVISYRREGKRQRSGLYGGGCSLLRTILQETGKLSGKVPEPAPRVKRYPQAECALTIDIESTAIDRTGKNREFSSPALPGVLSRLVAASKSTAVHAGYRPRSLRAYAP